MWFSLFATVLILAITFYQGLQGLFSALIMCILTILSAALAFGLYEDLYFAQLMAYQPDHGRAIALMAIFIVTLLALRLIFDQLVSGNMQFPVYVERAGGGAFGLVSAMIIIGMLAIGFQMLPLPTTFLGFTRYTLLEGDKVVVNAPEAVEQTGDNTVARSRVDWSRVEQVRNSLWLRPDGFTAALVSHLSGNALRGRNGFGEVFPDFLASLHRARDGLYRESLQVVRPDGLRVQEYWCPHPNEPFYTRQRYHDEQARKDMIRLVLSEKKLSSDLKRLVVRVTVKEETEDARDRSNFHFTTEQVRLLGREGKGAAPKEYFLAGLNDQANPHMLIELFRGEEVDRPRRGPDDKPNNEFDFVFEVPNTDQFEPWLIEYKQNARVEIRPSHKRDQGKPGPKPSARSRDQSGPDARPRWTPSPRNAGPTQDTTAGSQMPRSPDRPRGRVHGIETAEGGSAFSDRLPFKLTDYNVVGDMKIANGLLGGGTGRLWAGLTGNDAPRPGNKPPVERFAVPRNERLLQVRVTELDPGSLYGKMVGAAVRTRGGYVVTDDDNNKYLPVGLYAIAEVGGQRTFELVYLDQTAQDAGRIPRLDRIKHDHLRGNYQLFYLFHLPPGDRPVRLDTGRGGGEDLGRLNLVAPD